MRELHVSFDLIEAWESWRLVITDPDAPDEITLQWLNDNPNGWDWVHQVEGNNSGMTNLVIWKDSREEMA